MIQFNFARFVCIAIYRLVFGSARLGWAMGSLPIRLSFKTLSLVFAGLSFVAFKPAGRAIKNKYFKEPPPKRYIKTGKPAIAPLTVSVVDRPSMTVTPVAYKTAVRANREDWVRHTVTQKQMFMAKFADVVQVGA